MKLGQHLFKKDQAIWGKPLIEYDPERMNQVFSKIPITEPAEQQAALPTDHPSDISLETELYLMLHS